MRSMVFLIMVSELFFSQWFFYFLLLGGIFNSRIAFRCSCWYFPPEKKFELMGMFLVYFDGYMNQWISTVCIDWHIAFLVFMCSHLICLGGVGVDGGACQGGWRCRVWGQGRNVGVQGTWILRFACGGSASLWKWNWIPLCLKRICVPE